MLEAQPLETTSVAAVVPLDDQIPAQRAKYCFLTPSFLWVFIKN